MHDVRVEVRNRLDTPSHVRVTWWGFSWQAWVAAGESHVFETSTSFLPPDPGSELPRVFSSRKVVITRLCYGPHRVEGGTLERQA